MSQISPPIRILLVCAVAFLAAWMLVLRPKGDNASKPTPTPAPNVQTGKPAVSAPGKAAQLAKGAAAKTEAAEAATDKASGGSDAASAPATAAKPATTSARNGTPAAAVSPAALAALPKDVAAAVKARKILVLGVINSAAKGYRPMADDDRYFRNALRKANRYHGSVFVKRVPLSALSAYEPIIGDLHVNQTPSLVVVDRNLKGSVTAGYLDLTAINQAIVDARQASVSPLIPNDFLHRLNGVCARYKMTFDRFSYPTVRGTEKRWWKRLFRLAVRRRDAVEVLKAPARWKPLKARVLRMMDVDEGTARKIGGAVKAHDLNAFLAIVGSIDSRPFTKLDRQLDKAGVSSCVRNRLS